jgi:small subunit ribosomal protein S6
MEKILNNYEMLLVAPSNVTDDILDASFEKLTSAIEASGGALFVKDPWGRIRMAYPIQKQRVAKYFLLDFAATASTPLELERLVRLDKNFIRFLTVCIDKDVVDLDVVKATAEKRELSRKEKIANLKSDAR